MLNTVEEPGLFIATISDTVIDRDSTTPDVVEVFVQHGIIVEDDVADEIGFVVDIVEFDDFGVARAEDAAPPVVVMATISLWFSVRALSGSPPLPNFFFFFCFFLF